MTNNMPTNVLSATPDPKTVNLPLFSGKVSAGFPSPADDYVEKSLDLNDLLIQKPAATFFVRTQGESMLGAGIHPNDILVVKRLKRRGGQCVLASENPVYRNIVLREEMDTVIWGVVTCVIHPV